MRSVVRVLSASLPYAIAAALLAGPASAVTIDWVTVGDPGNACDPQATGCFGAVADAYRVSKYEVTKAQFGARAERAHGGDHD